MRGPSPRRDGSWAARRSPSGHTLLELLLSTAVVSIIMGAVVSTMLIAARAMNDSAAVAIAETGDALGQVKTDLSLAQEFTEREANTVTMKVPDRDGDNQAETIRYSWSGQAGDPLLCEYNGGSASIVAGNVHHFNLSYTLRTVAVGGSGGSSPQESDVMVLMQHDNAPGGRMRSYEIRPNRWCAQYFKPPLPADALSWKITRVRFRGREAGDVDDGSINVQIRTADGNRKPTSTVLATAIVREPSPLGSSYAWIDVDLGPVAGLDPDQGYCIVVAYRDGSSRAARIEYEERGNPMPSNTHWMTSGDQGSSWSNPSSNKDMRFGVYGTVTTPGS